MTLMLIVTLMMMMMLIVTLMMMLIHNFHSSISIFAILGIGESQGCSGEDFFVIHIFIRFFFVGHVCYWYVDCPDCWTTLTVDCTLYTLVKWTVGVYD